MADENEDEERSDERKLRLRAMRKLAGRPMGRRCTNCSHNASDHMTTVQPAVGSDPVRPIWACQICSCQVTIPSLNSTDVDPFA